MCCVYVIYTYRKETCAISASEQQQQQQRSGIAIKDGIID